MRWTNRRSRCPTEEGADASGGGVGGSKVAVGVNSLGLNTLVFPFCMFGAASLASVLLLALEALRKRKQGDRKDGEDQREVRRQSLLSEFRGRLKKELLALDGDATDRRLLIDSIVLMTLEEGGTNKAT